MKTIVESVASVLNSLIKTCKDGQEGFRSAADFMKIFDFKALFIEISLHYRQFAYELQNLVRDCGKEPETGGSFGGALRRGWLNLKAAITSSDEYAILVECESAEDAAVAAYSAALDHEELPADVRDVVQRQYMEIQAAHDRVRDLRDRLET
jgi:uncharacterized protein (TIGR02284 family)